MACCLLVQHQALADPGDPRLARLLPLRLVPQTPQPGDTSRLQGRLGDDVVKDRVVEEALVDNGQGMIGKPLPERLSQSLFAGVVGGLPQLGRRADESAGPSGQRAVAGVGTRAARAVGTAELDFVFFGVGYAWRGSIDTVNSQPSPA